MQAADVVTVVGRLYGSVICYVLQVVEGTGDSNCCWGVHRAAEIDVELGRLLATDLQVGLLVQAADVVTIVTARMNVPGTMQLVPSRQHHTTTVACVAQV